MIKSKLERRYEFQMNIILSIKLTRVDSQSIVISGPVSDSRTARLIELRGFQAIELITTGMDESKFDNALS